ncbi:MAG: hypothetical protein V9G19_25520 [Tetrasphaera sp.]
MRALSTKLRAIVLAAAVGGLLPLAAGSASLADDASTGSAGEPPLTGTILAFRQNEDQLTGTLLTMRPDGSNRRFLAIGVTFGASFSPDGRQVAFAKDGDIFVMPATGGAARRVVAGPHFSFGPTWSPNGRYLAYASRDENEPASWDVFRVTVASPPGSVVRLTTDALDAASGCGRAWGFDGQVRFGAPAWDPEGRVIAAVASCLPDSMDGDAAVVYLAPQGNRIVRVIGNPPKGPMYEPSSVDWSPDGGMVAMTDIAGYDHMGPGRFYVMNRDGTDRRQLVEPPDEEEYGATSPTWWPTGSYVAYHYRAGWEGEALWITNLAGTRKWKVAEGLRPEDWKP